MPATDTNPTGDGPRRRVVTDTTATTYRQVSRKGLEHRLYVNRACPYCGRTHTYRADGLRYAACGGGYVILRARKAWGTK
jgi:hypothetical protein